MLTRRIVFDLSLIAFVASAAFGFWTAHDAVAFTSRFWVLAVGAALALAATRLPSWRSLNGAMALFTLAGVVLSVRFLLFNDWAAPIWDGRDSKLALLDGLFSRIPSVMPIGMRVVIEPDVAGGIAAVAIPFAVLMLVTAGCNRLLRTAWLAVLAVLALTLFISLSYGAWLATGLALLLWLGWRVSGRWLVGRGWGAERAWRVRVIAIGAVLATGLAAYAALVLAPELRSLPVIGSVARRSSTWMYALPLVRDYAFTGLGLGNFGRPYPIYALLTYDFVTPRTRNLFADVQIEQGLLGSLSLITVLVIAVAAALRCLRKPLQDEIAVQATLAVITVVLINGAGNNPLVGSDGFGLGGLFALLPMAFAVTGAQLADQTETTKTYAASAHPKPKIVLAGGVLMVVVAATLVTWQSVLAAWHADLGAVAQARIEFSIHDPMNPQSLSLDDARRTTDLSHATAEFEQAIALDPANPTAHQRLAQIALARGDLAQALTHAQALWDAGHRDTITRLTLSDAYAAYGRVQEAADLVRGVSQADGRFNGQAWYRYWVNNDFERAAYLYGAAVALNGNPDAAHMRSEAEKAAKDKR